MPMQTRALSRAALALALALLAGPASCAADVLQAIPDTALAIVLVNRLEETSDKLERLAGQVHAPQQSLLTLLRVQTGIHEGLDEKGTAALALLPAQDAGGAPQVVVLLPLTDYKQFLAQLQPVDATQKFAEVRLAGNPVLICQHGNFAAIAEPDAKAALDDVLNSLKDAGTELTPLRTWLGEVDAAAVGTPAGIKFAISQAPIYLTPLRGMAQMSAPQRPEIGERFDALERGLKTFGNEVTHLALGVKADENANLRIAARTRFAAGGDWSNAVKGIKAPKEGVLAGLPGGPFGLACGLTIPEALREMAGSQISALVKVIPALAQLPAEQQTRLAQAAVDLIAPVDSLAMSLGVPKPGEPQYANFVGLLKVDDSQKYLDQYAAAIGLLSEALKAPQAAAIAYSVQKIDADGSAALDIVTDLSGFNQPGAAEVKSAFEKNFGASDKVHVYLAAVDDKTAVLAYVGVDNLKRAIAAAKAPGANLAADPQIAETAALLPKGGQWLGYLHPQTILTWAQPSPLAAAGPAQLPAAPPVGIAAKISAAGLNIDIAAPAATLQAIGQLVAQARGQQ